MSDVKNAIEAVRRQITDEPGAFHRLARLRRRRQRRRQVTFAAVAIVIAAAGMWAGTRAFSTLEPHHKPAAPPSLASGTSERIVFARDDGIYAMSPNGSDVRQLVVGPGDSHPELSPDGTRVVFIGNSQGNVYVANADGSNVTQLTSDGYDTSATWSPNGSLIAFTREQATGGGVHVMNADGSQVRRIWGEGTLGLQVAWSPTGAKLAYVGYSQTQNGNSPTHLYVMNSDGTGVTRIGPDDARNPAWSPDGSQIAFIQMDSVDIYRINADGSGKELVANLSGVTNGLPLTESPSWAPDGTKLAFAAGKASDSMGVYRVNVDGSGLIRLTDGYDPAWGTVASQSSPLP